MGIGSWIEVRCQRIVRSQEWWRIVRAVEDGMVYGPEIVASKEMMDFDILSAGDLVEVDGKWHSIKRVLLPSTLVLTDGRPVKKLDLPPEVRYRHRHDGSLVTVTLLATFVALGLGLFGVFLTLVGVLVAIFHH